MEPDKIVFFEKPVLRQPDMVAAFIGWPDAAKVSTGSVSYLINKLFARKLAEIKSDEFYDFAAIRPLVNIEQGIMSPLQLPTNIFYYWQNGSGDHDLIILNGIEPQMRWQGFVETIIDLALFYNVNRVYAIGGLYDRIPHTRETRVSGLVNDTALIPVLENNHIEPISYQGPSSVHGMLLTVCAMRRIPAISLWGHVPFYIRSESNPIVCLEMVKKISSMLNIILDLEELTKASNYLRDTLSKLIAGNEQMRSFLKSLEEQFDIEGSALGEPVEGAEQIIRDIEDFLRNQRHEG